MSIIKLIIISAFLLGCNNQNARLWDPSSNTSAVNVEIDPLSVSIGTTNSITGSCGPDGSSVIVTCDGGAAAPVICTNGTYTATNVKVVAIPVTCNADLTSPDGDSASDDDVMNIEVDAIDDIVTYSSAGTPNPVINVESNDTSSGCAPITYTAGTCTNCTFSGTLPSVIVTPTSAGTWDFAYTATCSDGTTSDSAAVSGTASGPVVSVDAVDDPIASSSPGTALPVLNVSTNDTDSNCAPIVYSAGLCTNCSVAGTLPSVTITPSANGAWSYTYTATCSDGTTSDTASVFGTAVTPIVDAVDDPITSSAPGVALPALDVSSNDTDSGCAPITYAAGACTNCTFSGTLPTVTITPTAVGAWNLSYTATCADGTTSDTAAVSGNATPIPTVDAVDDVITTSAAGTPLPALDVSSNDTDSNCTPITYAAGTCTNCTFAGTLPSVTITPTAAGAWNLAYTATCTDGTTSDTATVSGTAATPVVDAVDDVVSSSTAGSPNPVLDVSTNDTDSSCAPITYAAGTCTNCTFAGTLPSVTITPTAVGAWNLSYTATCADGSTSDTAAVSGTATVAPTIDAIDDPITSSTAGSAVPALDVSANDTSSNCAPITYSGATCTNCTFTGTLPSVTITPTAAGAWDLAYTATCDDGSTSDSAAVTGTAAAVCLAKVPLRDHYGLNSTASPGGFENDIELKDSTGVVIPAGECVAFTFTNTNGFSETLTGVVGDNISTFVSSALAGGKTVINDVDGVVQDGGSFDFDKQAWADPWQFNATTVPTNPDTYSYSNVNHQGVNASDMTIEIEVGGTGCSTPPGTPYCPAVSANTDNTIINERVYFSAHDNDHAQVSQIISGDGVTVGQPTTFSGAWAEASPLNGTLHGQLKFVSDNVWLSGLSGCSGRFNIVNDGSWNIDNYLYNGVLTTLSGVTMLTGNASQRVFTGLGAASGLYAGAHPLVGTAGAAQYDYNGFTACNGRIGQGNTYGMIGGVVTDIEIIHTSGATAMFGFTAQPQIDY